MALLHNRMAVALLLVRAFLSYLRLIIPTQDDPDYEFLRLYISPRQFSYTFATSRPGPVTLYYPLRNLDVISGALVAQRPQLKGTFTIFFYTTSKLGLTSVVLCYRYSETRLRL